VEKRGKGKLGLKDCKFNKDVGIIIVVRIRLVTRNVDVFFLVFTRKVIFIP